MLGTMPTFKGDCPNVGNQLSAAGRPAHLRGFGDATGIAHLAVGDVRRSTVPVVAASAVQMSTCLARGGRVA